MNKGGQVTIFIIVGVLVLGIIFGFFFLLKMDSDYESWEKGAEQKSTQNFLEVCLKDSLNEGVELITKQGGYIENPLHISYKLDDEDEPIDISYLCYTNMDHYSCVNQEPVLSSHIEDEIKEYIKEDSKNCFNELINAMEDEGYTIEDSNYHRTDVNLKRDYLEVIINAELTATIAGETFEYEEFKTRFMSSLHEIIEIVKKAVNEEIIFSGLGGFDYIRHNTLYPEFLIERFNTLDGSKIYIINKRDSDEEFRFAVRGGVTSGGIV